jgi:hypothetical protein
MLLVLIHIKIKLQIEFLEILVSLVSYSFIAVDTTQATADTNRVKIIC